MSHIHQLKEALPEYARDLKINLGNLLSGEATPGLQPKQVYAIALAAALHEHHRELSAALIHDYAADLTTEEINGVKAAVAMMGMTNVYYKFQHLIHDDKVKALPANLRMQVIGKPPIAKLDFELYSLAVSILAGCESCINAHIAEVYKGGFTPEAVHSTARIVSVVRSLAQIASMQA